MPGKWFRPLSHFWAGIAFLTDHRLQHCPHGTTDAAGWAGFFPLRMLSLPRQYLKPISNLPSPQKLIFTFYFNEFHWGGEVISAGT